MKFLCDVHISYKFINHIKKLGYNVLHVNEILEKWNTPDAKICEFADTNDYILISKDSDFRDSFHIKKTPKKLIKINLGNISNWELIQLFSDHLKEIESININPVYLIEFEKEMIQVNIPE